MAKRKIQIIPPDGGYVDVLHPETSADQVIANDGQTIQAKLGAFTVSKSVPSNALFTDTITTINGKTGAITKADIVALGIPASDTNTVYTHPTSAGNKHIPTGGAANQYLKYSASGTAVWSALGDAPTVGGKTIWVGAEGSKGTNANTIYFCY